MWLPIGSLYNNSSKEEIKHAFNVFFVGSSKSATHVYGMVSCNLSPCPSIYSKQGFAKPWSRTMSKIQAMLQC